MNDALWIKWLELITLLFCLLGVIIHVKFLTKENHRVAKIYLYCIYRRVRYMRFPIHQFSARWLKRALNVLYGESWGRRVATSLALSLIYTIVAINIGMYWSPWIFTAESEKTRIEKAIDPYLFGLPRAEKIAAFNEDHVEIIKTKGLDGKPKIAVRFTYNDKKYENIRVHAESFNQEYRNVVAEHPQRDAIAILTLLRGTNVSPGFQLGSVFSLVLFNTIIDLLAFLGTVALLSWLASTKNIWRFAAGSLVGLLGTVVLFFLTLLPYGGLVSGDIEVFTVLMVYFPFGVIMFLGGLGGLISMFVWPEDEMFSDVKDKLFGGAGGLFATGLGGWLIASFGSRILFTELPDFYVAGGVNWIPYLLAASTTILAVVCSVTILVVLILKAFGSTVHAAFQTYLEVIVKLKKPVVIAIFTLPAALLQFFSRVYPLLK